MTTDSVRLKKRDGRVANIPLDQLSEKDKAYVKGLKRGKADPAREKGEP
jgi:hypothetical protein